MSGARHGTQPARHNGRMDPSVIARLTSGEGAGLLASLPPYDETHAMSLAMRLRSEGFDPELVSAALTQSRRRARAIDKFGEQAGSMLFTPDGLEQATRPQLALLHARRFSAAGIAHVHDLGCGIGSDAMAMSKQRLAVSAVDADPVTAAVAEANLRPYPAAEVSVARAEAVGIPKRDGTGVWLDPARRTSGVADLLGHTKRTFSLEALSPAWDFVQATAGGAAAGGVKLSPSIRHGDIPRGVEAQWSSMHGEVLECALWWGAARQFTGRTAQVVGDEVHVITESDAAGAEPDPVRLDKLDGYLYQADKAVVRAGLTGALVRATDGRELMPGLGYVSSPRDVAVGWARRYAVRAAMPFNVKALRRQLRDDRIGRVTIKKRGVVLDSDTLRRQLRLSGDRDATMLITRVGGVQAVLIVQQIDGGLQK